MTEQLFNVGFATEPANIRPMTDIEHTCELMGEFSARMTVAKYTDWLIASAGMFSNLRDDLPALNVWLMNELEALDARDERQAEREMRMGY